MKIEKEKHRVNIICRDGSVIKGFVHVDPGLRVIDFFNNPKTAFLAVTEAEFYNIEELKSFKLLSASTKKGEVVILNKTSIKLVEETG